MLREVYLPCSLYLSQDKELMSCDTVYLALARLGGKRKQGDNYSIGGKLEKNKILKLLPISQNTLDKRLQTLIDNNYLFLSSSGIYKLNKTKVEEKGFVKLDYRTEVSKIFTIKTKYIGCVYGYLKRGYRKNKKEFTQVELACKLNITRNTVKQVIDAMVGKELIKVHLIRLDEKSSKYIFSLVNTVSKEEEINKILRDIEELKMQLAGEDLENATIALELLNKIKKGD